MGDEEKAAGKKPRTTYTVAELFHLSMSPLVKAPEDMIHLNYEALAQASLHHRKNVERGGNKRHQENRNRFHDHEKPDRNERHARRERFLKQEREEVLWEDPRSDAAIIESAPARGIEEFERWKREMRGKKSSANAGKPNRSVANVDANHASSEKLSGTAGTHTKQTGENRNLDVWEGSVDVSARTEGSSRFTSFFSPQRGGQVPQIGSSNSSSSSSSTIPAIGGSIPSNTSGDDAFFSSLLGKSAGVSKGLHCPHPAVPVMMSGPPPGLQRVDQKQPLMFHNVPLPPTMHYGGAMNGLSLPSNTQNAASYPDPQYCIPAKNSQGMPMRVQPMAPSPIPSTLTAQSSNPPMYNQIQPRLPVPSGLQAPPGLQKRVSGPGIPPGLQRIDDCSGVLQTGQPPASGVALPGSSTRGVANPAPYHGMHSALMMNSRAGPPDLQGMPSIDSDRN